MQTTRSRGFGLIETIVGIAIFVLIFLGLLTLLRVSIALSVTGKAQAVAVSVAESQMEHVRGLSYDALGTVGGIPAGLVPQLATTTRDGIDYVTRTFIQYQDDPADGIGAADANGIITDYKVGKVTVSYLVYGTPHAMSLVSNFVPPSIETSTGGGTLQINVVDALGAPLMGATVHIVNTLLVPSVDLTTFSNISGIVYLSGAMPSPDYQVTVSKSGYSQAQTYARTALNVNPTPGYLTVVANVTTTSTFAIDRLATFTLSTFSPPALTTWSDTFADNSKIAATSSVSVVSDALLLDAGSTSGSARSVVYAPALLASWGSVDATLITPSGTAAAVQVFDGSGVLLPDAVLAGNSAGLSTLPIDLSGVSTSTYPALALGALLTTSSLEYPSINDWSLTAWLGPTPLPNVSFTLTSTKSIGTDAGGASIYKNIVTDSTGASAVKSESLEWDAYTLDVSSYDVVDACPTPPYALSPASSVNASLTLDTPSTHRLLVLVNDVSGIPVSNASVQITKGGFSATKASSLCGNAYFGSLSAGAYDITISKTGYTTTVVSALSVSGQTYAVAAFP